MLTDVVKDRHGNNKQGAKKMNSFGGKKVIVNTVIGSIEEDVPSNLLNINVYTVIRQAVQRQSV